MTIILHIGAHKTATTHLQTLLDLANNGQNDIYISTPKNFRSSWFDMFLKYSQTQDSQLKQKLLDRAPKNDLWVISEENLIGVPFDFITEDGLYPCLEKRLKEFINLFPTANIKLFFSLRSYDTFYRSIYLEIVRNNGYISFEEYYTHKKFKQYTWKDIIATFAEKISPENITIWRYEDYTALLPIILKNITHNRLIVLPNNINTNEKIRISLSHKALQELKLYAEKTSQQASKEMVEYFYKKYPTNKLNKPFIPFNQDIIKDYQKKYKDDIQYISKNYPYINFLERL